MLNYENVYFQDKLPDENSSEKEYAGLIDLKNKIDSKLKSLETKIRISTLSEKISQENLKAEKRSGAIYFSPERQY